MKKMFIIILVIISSVSVKSQTISNVFLPLSVAAIDSIQVNITDSTKGCWLGVMLKDDNLQNKANFLYWIADKTRKRIYSNYYVLSGSDYISWDGTAEKILALIGRKYKFTFK